MTTQKYEKIHAISATVNGDRFAVSEWNNHVQVWDVHGGLVCKITTDLVSGMAKAISISEDGKQLAIAGYHNKTITLYDVKSREIIWQRKDIRRPAAAVILDRYADLMYIGTERQGAFFLDSKTGETVERLRGVEFIRESQYSTIDQYEKSFTSQLVRRADRKVMKGIPHKSFALLDACFTKDKFVSTYSGNPLAAVSLYDFETLWATHVSGHFLKIEYSNELDKLLGIRWDFENRSPKYLCYIDTESGEIENEINLGEPIEVEFLKQGSLLITSQGKLYSTLTGQQICQFDFENA